MRNFILFILAILFVEQSYSQNKTQQESKPIGIGLRIGDFNGISFKYYLEDIGISLEANIGISYFSGDDYELRFKQYATENQINYVNYLHNQTIEHNSFGYRIDIQKYGEIEKIPHFYWFAGVGFQARKFTLEHNYSYIIKVRNSTATLINGSGKAVIDHTSYGVNLMTGGEYLFQEFPLSFFVDALLFYEAFGLRNNLIWQLGMGSRFHF